MVNGKRYQVFSIRETKEKDGRSGAVWVRAGSAWVNRDGSMNVYLDVLPLDGKLHVREASERRDEKSENAFKPANGSSAETAMEAGSTMGGH